MHGHAFSLITDIGLSIMFAAAAGHAARILRQPPLLGYILGGVLLGPTLGLGWVSSPESVEIMAEIGLLFLLFIIGLEINLRDLARMGAAMIGVGVVQFTACAGLGWILFRTLGPDWGGRFDAVYFAVATALSSTLIVVKLLHDKFELHTASGRLTVGVLVIQDLWAIAFLAFQPNLADPRLGGILRSLGLGVLLVAAAFLFSRYVLSRLMNAASKSPELILLTSAAWCFAVAGGAEQAGLSKEMGALIAGLSMAAFPFGADVSAKLGGVRDFFVTLFFVALGLKAPKPALADMGAASLAVLMVLGGRFLSLVPSARLLGAGTRNGLTAAVNLSQVSEFSLVILAMGLGLGHVSETLSRTLLIAMIAASVLSTYLIQYNDAVARAGLRALALLGWRDRSAPSEGGGEKQRDIIVLGYFREGPAFVDAVEREAPALKERILIVDFNASLRQGLEARGFRWAYGDLAHPETLRHLGLAEASVVVCTLSDTYLKGISSPRLAGQLRQAAPRARLLMVADDAAGAEQLLGSGADHAVVPGRLAGEALFGALEDPTPRP
jgi:Kef-type K+ transport system membrane component KefB